MAINKEAPGLFDRFVEETNLEYPVVVKYKHGPCVEAFQSNGVRLCITVSKTSISFTKTKFKASIINREQIEDAKKEYETFIKRMMYIHEPSTIEDFNRYYENWGNFNVEMDELKFEDELELGNVESDTKPLTKNVRKQQENTEQKSDCPF